jgi:hypothetical protein
MTPPLAADTTSATLHQSQTPDRIKLLFKLLLSVPAKRKRALLGSNPPRNSRGLPVLRALSLCTCCRHYPGAADGRGLRSCHPSVSAFPDSTIGSVCTSSFSRFARRSLALRPAHSRSHLGDRYPRASDISSPPCLPRLLPAGAIAGWALHPLEKRRLARRTWFADIRTRFLRDLSDWSANAGRVVRPPLRKAHARALFGNGSRAGKSYDRAILSELCRERGRSVRR